MKDLCSGISGAEERAEGQGRRREAGSEAWDEGAAPRINNNGLSLNNDGDRKNRARSGPSPDI